MKISKLESDWLISHHLIWNSKFLPIAAFAWTLAYNLTQILAWTHNQTFSWMEIFMLESDWLDPHHPFLNFHKALYCKIGHEVPKTPLHPTFRSSRHQK